MAIAARMPMIATTTRSSIRVKPDCLLVPLMVTASFLARAPGSGVRELLLGDVTEQGGCHRQKAASIGATRRRSRDIRQAFRMPVFSKCERAGRLCREIACALPSNVESGQKQKTSG